MMPRYGRRDLSAYRLIGDAANDFEAAQAMGAACWLIPAGNHSHARIETCGVPVLDSLRDVAKRLRR